MHERAGRRRKATLREYPPQFGQKVHVGTQRGLVRAFGDRAHDVAAGRVGAEFIFDDTAQPRALGLVLDAGRYADAMSARHVHHIARRQCHERRQARALGAERILDDLHEQLVALADQRADVVGARLRRGIALGRDGEVGGMEERRTVEPDFDERRLHARQHARGAALVDVARQAAAVGPLEVDLDQHAVLDDGGTRFARRDVDQDFSRHEAAPDRACVIPARASSVAVSYSGRPMIPV